MEEAKTLTRIAYIILASAWTVIIYSLHFRSWILVIPYIVFAIGFYNAGVEESKTGKALYINIGIILAFGLLQWALQQCGNKKQAVSYVATLALILTLITYIDVWASEKSQYVLKHIRSSLQCMGITLFVFALMIFHQNIN